MGQLIKILNSLKILQQVMTEKQFPNLFELS